MECTLVGAASMGSAYTLDALQEWGDLQIHPTAAVTRPKPKGRRPAAQTAHLKKAFLDDYAQTGNIGGSAQAVGVSRRTVYNWRDKSATFAEALEVAALAGQRELEVEARRRAIEGTVNRFGEKEYSDTLLIFLLKARDPKRYATQRTELTGREGGPLEYSDADLDRKIEGFLDRLAAREGTPTVAGES